MIWTYAALLLLLIFLMYVLFGFIKVKPEQFSEASIQRSIFVLGVLALLLIMLVTLMLQLMRWKI